MKVYYSQHANSLATLFFDQVKEVMKMIEIL